MKPTNTDLDRLKSCVRTVFVRQSDGEDALCVMVEMVPPYVFDAEILDVDFDRGEVLVQRSPLPSTSRKER